MTSTDAVVPSAGNEVVEAVAHEPPETTGGGGATGAGAGAAGGGDTVGAGVGADSSDSPELVEGGDDVGTDDARSGACAKRRWALVARVAGAGAAAGAPLDVDFPGFAWATSTVKPPTSATQPIARARRTRASFARPALRVTWGGFVAGSCG